jgi:hypothetical protein
MPTMRINATKQMEPITAPTMSVRLDFGLCVPLETAIEHKETNYVGSGEPGSGRPAVLCGTMRDLRRRH